MFTGVHVGAFWSKTDSKEQAIETQQVSSQLPNFIRLAKKLRTCCGQYRSNQYSRA